MANPKVKTPKRPINIKAIITNLPPVFKSPVIPVLKPTVPSAEETSNRISSNLKSLVKVIKKVPISIMIV